MPCALQTKGIDAGQAAMRVSSLELGGLLGSLVAGRISDYMIEKAGGKGGNVGKRVQVRGLACSPPWCCVAVHHSVPSHLFIPFR